MFTFLYNLSNEFRPKNQRSRTAFNAHFSASETTCVSPGPNSITKDFSSASLLPIDNPWTTAEEINNTGEIRIVTDNQVLL